MINLLYSDDFLNDSRTSGIILNINNVVLVNYYRPVSNFIEFISPSYVEGDRSRVSIKNVESVKNDPRHIQLSITSDIDIVDKCLLYFYYDTNRGESGKLGGVIFDSENPGNILKIMSGVNNLIDIPLKENILADIYLNETDLDLNFLEGNGFREGVSAFSSKESEEPLTTSSYDKLIDINNLHNAVEKNIKNDKFQVGYWNSLDRLGRFNPRYYISNKYSNLTTTISYSDGTLGEGDGKSITTDKLSGKLILLGKLTVDTNKIFEYGENQDSVQKEVSLKEIPLRVSVKSDSEDLQLSFNQITGVLDYKSSKEGNFKIISEIIYTNLETSEITSITSEVNLTIGNSSTEWEIIETTPSYSEQGKRLYVFSNPEIGDSIKFTIKTIRTLSNKGEVEYGNGFNTWFNVSTEKKGENEIVVTISIKKKNDNPNLWAPIVNDESRLIPCSIKFLESEIETFYCVQEPLMTSLDLCKIGEDGNLEKINKDSLDIVRGTNNLIYPTIISGGEKDNYWFVSERSNNISIFPNKGVLNANTVISQQPKDEYYKTNLVGSFNSELIFYRISGETDISLITDDWRSIINIPKKSLSINVTTEVGKNILDVSTDIIEVDRYGIYQFNITSSAEFTISIEKKIENIGYYVKLINPETNKIIEEDSTTYDACENKEFFVVINPLAGNIGSDGFCDLKISLTEGEISKTIKLVNNTKSEYYSKLHEIYREPASLSFPNELTESGGTGTLITGMCTLFLTTKSESIHYMGNRKLKVINNLSDEVETAEIVDIFDCTKLNINRGYIRSELSLKLKNEPENKNYPTSSLGGSERVIVTPMSSEAHLNDIKYTIAPKKDSPNIYLKNKFIKSMYLTEVGDKVEIEVYSNYPLTKEDLNYPINILESNIKDKGDGLYIIEMRLIKSVEKNSSLGKLIIKKLIVPSEFYTGFSVNKGIIDNILSDQTYVEINIRSAGRGSDYSISGDFSNINYFGETRTFYINFEDGAFNKNLNVSTTATNYSTVKSDINSRKINLSVYSRLLGYNKPYQVNSTDGYTQLSKTRNVGFDLNIFNTTNPGTILYNERVSIPQEKLLYGLLLNSYDEDGGYLFIGDNQEINNTDILIENSDTDHIELCIGNFPTSSKIVEDTIGYISNLLLFESSSEMITTILSDSEKIYYGESKNAKIYFPKNNLLEEVVSKIYLSDSYGNKALLNIIQKPVDPVYNTTVRSGAYIRFDYTGTSIYVDEEGENQKLLDPEIETNIPIDQLEIKSATLINPKLEFIKVRNTNNNTTVYKLVIKVDPYVVPKRESQPQPLIGTLEILYKNNKIWECIGVQECITVNFMTRLGVSYSGSIIGEPSNPIHTPAENSGTLSSERQYFKLSASVWRVTLSPDGSHQITEEIVTDYLKISGYNWILNEEFLNVFSSRETKLLFSDPNISSGFPILENIYSTDETFIETEVPYVVEVLLILLSTKDSGEGNYLPKITMYLQKDKKTVTSKVRKKK